MTIFPNSPVCEYCWSWVGIDARFTGKCPHCGANLDKEHVYALVEIFRSAQKQIDKIGGLSENLDLFTELEPVELSESASSYRSSLRAVARGLWSGVIDFDQFWDNFSNAIRSGLTRAWHEGARKAGISPDELTKDELAELQNTIFGQFGHIAKLGDWIERNSKSEGGKLGAVLSRIELWVQAYPSTVNKAYAMAAANAKAEWVYGDTEHCKTCKALHGKVKRMSFWFARVMPRNPPNRKLDCGGWRCQCNLVPTDKPLSRGPLPMGL